MDPHGVCLQLSTFRGFPAGTSGKESTSNAEDIRDVGSVPGNTMDRGAWQAAVRRVKQSQTQQHWVAHMSTFQAYALCSSSPFCCPSSPHMAALSRISISSKSYPTYYDRVNACTFSNLGTSVFVLNLCLSVYMSAFPRRPWANWRQEIFAVHVYPMAKFLANPGNICWISIFFIQVPHTSACIDNT